MPVSGPCPYEDCDHDQFTFSVDDGDDVERYGMVHDTCAGCGRTFWVLFSRIRPEAMTEAEFALRYEVDEATKEVRDRPVHGCALPPEMLRVRAERQSWMERMLHDAWNLQIMMGMSSTRAVAVVLKQEELTKEEASVVQRFCLDRWFRRLEPSPAGTLLAGALATIFENRSIDT